MSQWAIAIARLLKIPLYLNWQKIVIGFWTSGLRIVWVDSSTELWRLLKYLSIGKWILKCKSRESILIDGIRDCCGTVDGAVAYNTYWKLLRKGRWHWPFFILNHKLIYVTILLHALRSFLQEDLTENIFLNNVPLKKFMCTLELKLFFLVLKVPMGRFYPLLCCCYFKTIK